MPQCTAWSRQNGRRCRNKAVTGWNVCRMHGAEGGRPIKHGIYSKKVNTKLSDIYEEFLEEVDNISALNEDIALMRAMMVQVLNEEPQNKAERNNQINLFLKYMRDIRYAIELKDDIESKYMVSIETIQIFLNQLIFILKKHIRDEGLLQNIMNDMRKVKLLEQDTQKPRKLRESFKRRG